MLNRGLQHHACWAAAVPATASYISHRLRSAYQDHVYRTDTTLIRLLER
jgi:hypothetical protein